jgi:selenocysteine lyase/cysteine desulfurase
MFVGGEFYYDYRWISDTPTISTEGMYFLNGGKACLIVISDYLLDHGVNKILLPSYLCPSIVQTFEQKGLICDYYQINEDLSIDLEDLAQKIVDCKAIYFINYFGFLHPLAVLNFLQSLRENGVIVVEDNAQAGFHNHPTGDFILNSIRKFAAYDGGYLITPHDMTDYLEKYRGYPERRLSVIRNYRGGLPRYLFGGQDNHNELEEMFNLAEQYYETDIVVYGDLQERHHIERLDWKGIKQIRRDNYQYLLSLIQSIAEISPIFPTLQEDNMPLGLPVYFMGVSRDSVNEELGKAAIGLSIHWDAIRINPYTRGNRSAVDMTSRMLTLVIDQYTSHKQMDYLVLNLIRGIAVAKTKIK